MLTTLEYYNKNAYEFVQNTLLVDFKNIQDKFLEKLPVNACVLDFGCGAGRDTKYFLKKGYQVDATDGSEEICKMASDYTGIKVKQMLFEELDENEKYDGIWACASILHLSKDELKPVFIKMIKALKVDGVIYTSFKYGEFEGERNGRFFTDFTEASFDEFIKPFNDIEIIECWISGDARPEREEEKWLNLILQKVNTH